MTGQRLNIIQAISDYGSKLFRFIRGRVSTDEDAEDIIQDVWYQLSSQARLEDIESISGWLYRVTRNKITDSYRKKNNLTADYSESLTGDDEWMMPFYLLNEEYDPEQTELIKMFREILLEALGELPPEQRRVFLFNEMEDKTLQEIADSENENIKTIISRKRYAVLHLRRRLEFLYNEFLND